MKKDFYEIERKFLVKKLPDNLENYKKVEIKQGYISKEPALRLRKQDDSFFFTFKSFSGGKNIEFEQELTEQQFGNLWKKIEDNPIVKTRYFIPIKDNLLAELDIYKEHLKGFVNVEVEFTSVSQSENFSPPSWFGKDISKEKRYSNASLSELKNFHFL